MMPWSHGRPRYGQPCGESECAHWNSYILCILFAELDKDDPWPCATYCTQSLINFVRAPNRLRVEACDALPRSVLE